MIACTFENGNKASLRHVVVDVIIKKDDQILLVKRTKKLVEGGKWALIGGFMEHNETIKEAIAREIFEETGWRVKDLTLLRVKDGYRPHELDRENISFVFYCTADKKEGEKDWESDEVKWFPLDSLPAKEEIAFDHADDLAVYLQFLKDGKEPKVLA